MLSLTTHAHIRSAVLAIVAALSVAFAFAQDGSVSLSPAALREVAQVEAEIDRIEAQALERLSAPPNNQVQQIELLGKVMLYDKHLSVNRNEACAFCHMPQTGFTGPVSELNATTGSYPGSVRTRFSDRKPQTHSYAPLSPVLHFNQARGDLVGGNFWDMRATGVASETRRPSKRKGPSSTRWKWPFRTPPVPSTAPPSGPIARYLKASGARKLSQSRGRVIRNRCATARVRRPRVILWWCISARSTVGEP